MLYFGYFLLSGEVPPSTETVENGIKKVVEYKRNEDGKLVKVGNAAIHKIMFLLQ